MNNNLPKVFQNRIEKKITNNKKAYYSNNKENIIKNDTIKDNKNIEFSKNINKKINDIFKSTNYVYKANVEIKTKTNTINTRIIGRNKKYLITFENEVIPIEDIIDIKKNS